MVVLSQFQKSGVLCEVLQGLFEVILIVIYTNLLYRVYKYILGFLEFTLFYEDIGKQYPQLHCRCRIAVVELIDLYRLLQ